MENVKQEHVIAGIIGGVSTLFLAFAIRKGMRQLGLKKRCGPPPPKVECAVSTKLPAALGPYSAGKKISYKRGTQYLYTSG